MKQEDWRVNYLLHGCEHAMKISASTQDEAELKAEDTIDEWLKQGRKILSVTRWEPIFADEINS